MTIDSCIWNFISRAHFYSYKVRLWYYARRFLGRFYGHVLDVGAGSQPYRSLLSKESRYVAMEYSEVEGADVRGSVLDLPFTDAVFDGVLCTEVLEHVTEPVRALQNINRVLRQEGLLYVTVPMTWGLHYEPHDFYRYTKYSLFYIAEKSNFEVLEMVQIGGLFTAMLARLEDVIISLLYRLTFFLKPILSVQCRVAIVSFLLFPLVVLVDIIASLFDRCIPGAQQDALGWAMLARKKREVIL